MADNKKMVDAITSMETDFAQWYTDVVKKAELVDYSGVKGCMIIRPYGYAIWENIQHDLDARFKRLGHENVYMPMFIPESLESIIKILLDVFPDSISVGADDHTSLNAGVVDKVCLFNDICVPLGEVFVHRGNFCN